MGIELPFGSSSKTVELAMRFKVSRSDEMPRKMLGCGRERGWLGKTRVDVRKTPKFSKSFVSSHSLFRGANVKLA